MAKFLTKHFQAYDVGFNINSSTKASAQETFKGTLLGAGAIAQRMGAGLAHDLPV